MDCRKQWLFCKPLFHAILPAMDDGVRADRRKEVYGLLEVALAMALAGSSVVVGKLLSSRVPVFLSAELSLLTALAAVLPAQIAVRRELRGLGRRDLGYMFLQALFGMVLFRTLTLYGLKFTPAGHAGLITSSAPMVMAVLAAAVLRERIGVRGLLGVGLSAAGLLFINVAGFAAALGPAFLVGNALIFAATVCEALLTIFRKSSGGTIGSITNTTMLVAISAVLLLPFALSDLREFSLAQVDTVGWLAILYYGAVATVIAYILWGHGALQIPASTTGMATAMLPLSALVLSGAILKEEIGPFHIMGCVTVVLGILVGRKGAAP